MKQISAFVGVALLVLAGCTTSKEEYATVQTALEGSPKLRAMTIADCGKRLEKKPAGQKEILAALMNVSTQSVPSVFCRRVIHGISQGHITHAEFVAAEHGRPSPKVIRLLQGR
jgi:hypothetical protein